MIKAHGIGGTVCVNDSKLLKELGALSSASGVSLERCARTHGLEDYLASLPETPGVSKLGQDIMVERLAHRMKMVAVLREVLLALKEDAVDVLTFKGPALSQLLFGDPFRRDYGDIDLMVRPAHLTRAYNCLKNLDFKLGPIPFSSPGQLRALHQFCKARTLHRGSATTIDLHWRLLSQWVAFEPCFETLWRARRTLDLAPDLEAQTFGPEHQILFLAFHGSQDGWVKLCQLLDLTLAMDMIAYEPAKLYAQAGHRRPLLDRALSLAVDVLGAKPPEGHRPFFASAELASSFLISTTGRTDAPQLPLLAPALWEGSPLAALSGSLRAILTPAVDDIASVKLPTWGVQGYVLVRLCRLLGKFLQRRKLK